MNRVWTEEELEILRRDREARIPVPVTAAKLGRPVPATYARARLIGTLVQPHQSWDEASVARLRELVSADPPMTDKHIAAQLGRTVTQIRWKMQDLGLIGVRDLSKLAKITAAGTARPKTDETQSTRSARAKAAPQTLPRQRPVMPSASTTRAESPARTAAPVQSMAQQTTELEVDLEAALAQALKRLETSLAERLNVSIAESDAGMIRAARAAIAEKARIDQRLLVRVKRAAEAAARREAEARKAEEEAKHQALAARKAEAEAKRKAAEQAAEAARQAREEKARLEKTQAAAPKSAPRRREAETKKPVLPAVRGVSQAAAARPVLQAVAPAAPKIVVTEAPASVRSVEPEPANAPTSGRGGWKSVRRDPARVLAQAKAKAKPANRADAIDLAQAAQAAIERFIAERGVTKSESSGIQAVVSRLQARGYIVVRDETGWTIDQRHRIDSESDLVAFAEARGIALSAAA